MVMVFDNTCVLDTLIVFLCGPKMVKYKSGHPKGCSDRWDVVIGWIGDVFKPLAITFGCH